MKKAFRTGSTVFSRLIRTQVVMIVALVALILSVYAVHAAISVQNTIDKNSRQMLASFSEDADAHVLAFAENFLQQYVLADRTIVNTFRSQNEEITLNQISDLCGTLHSYLLTNQMLHSIYVYYLQSNMVVSTNGVYLLGEGGDEHEDVAWIADREFASYRSWTVMNDYKLHYTLSSAYAADVLSLVQKYPLRSRDQQYTGYVAVNLSAAEVYKAAVTQNVTEDSFFLMADADGRILKNPDAPASLAEADLSGLMAEGTYSFSLPSGKYTVLCRESAHGMRYLNFVPTAVYWDEISSTILLAAIIAIVAMIAPAVASSMVIKRIYSPIQHLAERSREVSSQLLGASDHEGGASESVISTTIDRLAGEVSQLKDRLSYSEQETAFLHYLFSRRKPDNLSEAMQKMGISFPYSHFTSCILILAGDEGLQDGDGRQQLYERLEAYAREPAVEACEILASTGIVQGLVLLINYEDEHVPNFICDELHSLTETISNQRLISAVSMAVEDPEQIHPHFLKTLQALEYLFLYPDFERFYERDLLTWEQSVLRIEPEMYEQLRLALKTGNEKDALQTLNLIEKKVRQQSWSLKSVKDELQMLDARLSDMMAVFLDISETEPFVSPEEHASQADDLRAAFEIMARKVQRFCKIRGMYISSRAAAPEYSPILQYIDECIDRTDVEALSLASVAEHFGKSPNYLSTIFLNIAGVNFKEYVSEKKLEKAAEKLKQPDAVVKAVANELGYYNVSNFIKIFKQKFGYTPGQYKNYALTQQLDDEEKRQ